MSNLPPPPPPKPPLPPPPPIDLPPAPYQSIVDAKLYHMTRIENVPSIYFYGLWARSELRGQGFKIPVDVADKKIISRRGQKAPFGIPLTEYVPLYWTTHTAMQFRVMNSAIDQFAILVYRAADLFDLEVISSDRNAADSDAKFWRGFDAISEIDWGIINYRYCKWDWKAKKAAEVLVRKMIPVNKLSCIYVASSTAHNVLINKIAAYIGQFEANPSRLEELERQAKLVGKGPTFEIRPSDFS